MARSGRPPKFAKPRRPITVTLPESTLKQLRAVDSDRARAIVKLAELSMAGHGSDRKSVEVVEVTPGIGIILVGPSSYLQRISWLRLVEVAPTRFLLSIPSGTHVDSLELALIDLVDTIPPSEIGELEIINDLRHLMRHLRRRSTITKGEMLFIDTSTLRKPK